MIFGFSHYGLDKRGSQSEPSQLRDSEAEVVAPVANQGGPLSSAQIYDLAHQRRLRALQSYIEQGHTLSEAARLLGVSRLTVCRWDDHGRR